MYTAPGPRLISLAEAFDRIGRSFVKGWTGDERASASLGQRAKAPLSTWLRARSAMLLAENFARDGRIAVVAYDGDGGRMRYFEHAREELRALLLPPDPNLPGLVQLRSGTTMVCEIDVSSLRLRSSPLVKVGRKPKYVRFEELIAEAIQTLGVSATNTDLKNFARAKIDRETYPENRSTQNDVIERIRRRLKGR